MMEQEKRERGHRVWRYTVAEIAAAAGVEPHQVKYARSQGRLDPGSLASVARYVVGHMLERDG
jgi:hypothetical protein